MLLKLRPYVKKSKQRPYNLFYHIKKLPLFILLLYFFCLLLRQVLSLNVVTTYMQ